MKKNYFKYIESLIFLFMFIFLLKLKIVESTSYLIDFSLGNFFFLFVIYFFLRVFIPFVQNKMLKDILRSRLNSFLLLVLLIVNVIVCLNIEEYSYESFFLYSIEKFKTGGLFVSLFGKLYGLISKNLMLSLSGFLIFILVLYTFGKIIGFVVREREKRKSGEYYINKQRQKEEKDRINKAKKEEKKIKKREEVLESIEKEEIVPDYLEGQGDFLVDIKKEFQTILSSKDRHDNRDKNIDDEKRKKIQDEIRKRHELKKSNREENEDEEKTEIIFIKNDEFSGETSTKEESLKTPQNNHEKPQRFYPNELIELSNYLEISIEKLQKAIELVHKDGIKGSAILERELRVGSDEAERIYLKVKRLKEYK